MAKIAPFDVDSDGVHPMFKPFATQVKKAFIDIAQHFLNLSPIHNFNGFLYEGTIPAGTEIQLVNRAKTVPTGKIVIFNQGGYVEDGATANSKDFVYLRNPGVASVTVKVFFFL